MSNSMESTRNNSTIAIANNVGSGPSRTRTIPSSCQRQGNWDHKKVRLSSNANMLNMQFKRNYKILTHIWCMLHSDGVRSWRNLRKLFNPKYQVIGKCAKRNGMD